MPPGNHNLLIRCGTDFQSVICEEEFNLFQQPARDSWALITVTVGSRRGYLDNHLQTGPEKCSIREAPKSVEPGCPSRKLTASKVGYRLDISCQVRCAALCSRAAFNRASAASLRFRQLS